MIINSDEFKIERPDLNYFLKDYNQLLAGILLEKPNSLKYLASATLNRHEALTHLYEKIEVYRQLTHHLKNSDEHIRLRGKDLWLAPFLVKKFGNRIHVDGTIPKTSSLSFIKTWATQFIKSLLVYFLGRKDRASNFEAVVRSYFDHRCLKQDGSLREEYLGPFVDDLAKNKKVLVLFKFLSYKDFRNYLLIKESSFQRMPLERVIGLSKIIKVFTHFLFSSIKLSKKYYYRGLDVTGLIQKSLDDDYNELRNIGPYIDYEVAKIIFEQNPSYFYYPYENQAWEKIYPFVRNALSSKTKIIAFQHTGVSFKLLNYFPTERERQFPFFPDKILTVGATLKKVLEDYAYYPCPIEIGAALRHYKHTKDGSFNFLDPKHETFKAVVYAFSYDILKYSKIIQTLISCFSKSTISVYLKIHPDYDENKIIDDLNIKLPPQFILAQKIPWDQLYSQVDCVFYDDNSIGVESLIKGIKSYQLDVDEPIYNCDRLFNFTLWNPVIDFEGIERIKDEISEQRFDKQIDSAYIQDYIRSYYNPYKYEEHYQRYFL